MWNDNFVKKHIFVGTLLAHNGNIVNSFAACNSLQARNIFKIICAKTAKIVHKVMKSKTKPIMQ